MHCALAGLIPWKKAFVRVGADSICLKNNNIAGKRFANTMSEGTSNPTKEVRKTLN
jgi:hypothetical protein